MTKKPLKTFRAKNVSVSVWENKNVNAKGEEFMTKNLTLQRSYKKDNSEDWISQQITIPNVKELAKINVVVRQAAARSGAQARRERAAGA